MAQESEDNSANVTMVDQFTLATTGQTTSKDKHVPGSPPSQHPDVPVSTTRDREALSDGTSELELDKTEKAPLRIRVKGASKRVRQYQDYIRLMEDRMSNLERTVTELSVGGFKNKSGGYMSSPQETDANSKDLGNMVGKEVSGRDFKMRVSIPQLDIINWEEWNSLQGDRIPRQHYAIDILSDEPSVPHFVRTMHIKEQISENDGNGTALQGEPAPLHDKHSSRPELPERIRINSRRIQCVLDYDLCDGSLHCKIGHTYTLLRPFKLLVFQEANIRERLREFERARAAMGARTEEEYACMFASDPVPNDGPRKRQGESLMTLSQLIGMINDLRCLIQFIDDYMKPVKSILNSVHAQYAFLNFGTFSSPAPLSMSRKKRFRRKCGKLFKELGAVGI